MRNLIYFLLISSAINLAFAGPYNLTGEWSKSVVNGELCNRQCGKFDIKTCYFNFDISHDHTMSIDCRDCPQNPNDCFNQFCMSADGVPRTVSVVNKRLAGPLIRVCKNDRIVVDVKNSLQIDTTSIHWHGMLQEGTQYNDGVPYITQCPIQPGATFRYQFIADDSGTYFYHSHSGLQRVDGVTGPLIVSEPDADNPMRRLYDFDLDEHIMIIFDWDHELALSKYEGRLHWVNGTNQPNSMLVNGLGRNRTYTVNGNTAFTPTARFKVRRGSRYRFRLINSGNLDCPIMVSIDGHKMTVISSDGNDFEPVEVDSLMTLAGERYDFVLNAYQPGGVFWIKFQGQILCGPEYNAVRQVAVLQYDDVSGNNVYPPGNPTYEETSRTGLQLNPLEDGVNVPSSITLAELTAIQPVESALKRRPDFVYYLPFDLRSINNPNFRRADPPTPQIANITFQNLPFPMLSQRNELVPGMFCNEMSFAPGHCRNNFCQCPHVIQLPYRGLVELVLINEAREFVANHPFHLHGFKFRVVSYDRVGNMTSVEDIKRLDSAGRINRNLNTSPIKDTFNVPPGGFTIIRFIASNPGFWFFHCHVDPHVEEGMAMVFQVGNLLDMPLVPIGFPKCGNYLPPVYV